MSFSSADRSKAKCSPDARPEDTRGAGYNDRLLATTTRTMPAAIPAVMHYVIAREPGPPEVLVLSETATPAPKTGEVLIEVAYAGVNRPDCIQRAGHYPPPPDASPIIGLEVAGSVVALGEGVTEWRSAITSAR